MTDLHYLSLAGVCRRMKSGELSALEVTESMLGRIEALDSELHSFAIVMADDARAAAARLDKARADGKPLGALHGVPVAVKDLFDTRGVATASGTRVMRDRVPEEDATVVRRLKDAGAVIIGKTQLTEGAYGTHHPDVDPPRNPWEGGHWTGVSSSGSGVAVAAGLAFGALGSDTGGSIRFPSACCGLVGIKPTYGRVSRHGAFPLAESLDHAGPMTRTVEDAGRLLQVLAGSDPNDATTQPDPVPNYAACAAESLPGLRVGVDWDYVSSGVDEPVVQTIRDALDTLRDLGASVVDTQMPASAATLVRGWGVTCGMECARAHREFYPDRKAEYGPVLAAFIDYGLAASREDYGLLETVRAEFRNALNGCLEHADVIIAPCMPELPPPLDALEDESRRQSGRADLITFTAPFNYSGHPTITLPAALNRGELPRAFQLIARPMGEPTLLRAGSAFERSVGLNEHPIP
ncbi:MAG: Asp-tRNA(Asn)/Glu-tRNA(Gln) amidotransferase GatCAB subunit A [Pseudomonadales bacterium]|nr:amidase [Pseudomonadales bacterium]NIX09421.1 Asp-tRNA(Asn)/Glu-tRNA(Gln) amidotransferase GatCAB subunit A [Pseudomonadales bacterium]